MAEMDVQLGSFAIRGPPWLHVGATCGWSASMESFQGKGGVCGDGRIPLCSVFCLLTSRLGHSCVATCHSGYVGVWVRAGCQQGATPCVCLTTPKVEVFRLMSSPGSERRAVCSSGAHCPLAPDPWAGGSPHRSCCKDGQRMRCAARRCHRRVPCERGSSRRPHHRRVSSGSARQTRGEHACGVPRRRGDVLLRPHGGAQAALTQAAQSDDGHGNAGVGDVAQPTCDAAHAARAAGGGHARSACCVRRWSRSTRRSRTPHS